MTTKFYLDGFVAFLTLLLPISALGQNDEDFKGAIGYVQIGEIGFTIALHAEHSIFFRDKWFANAHVGYAVGKSDYIKGYSHNTNSITLGVNSFFGKKNPIWN